MRAWRFDPISDDVPDTAEPGDLEGRRAVFLIAPSEDSPRRAWVAVDDYDGDEATVLFGAPAGEHFHDYVRALLVVAIQAAQDLGFASLLAHWRAGWRPAEADLSELGFEEGAPGMWRRRLNQ